MGSWRKKVILVLSSLPFIVIIYLYLEIRRKDQIIHALRFESYKTANEISESTQQLSQLHNLEKDVQLQKVLLQLDETAVRLGVPRKKEEQQEVKEVCPEKYLGTKGTGPYKYTAFAKEDCAYGKDMGDLVTVLINLVGEEWAQERLNRLVMGLRKAYPRVDMVVAVDRTKGLKVPASGVEIVQTGNLNPWRELVSRARTKYVLLGFDLDYASEWIDLERAVRVIGRGVAGVGKGIGGVGGAVRNRTGHWKVGCYQVDMRYYRMELREGYKVSDQDCMVCDAVGGPLLVPREGLFDSINPDLPEDVIMLDWFIKTKRLQLACPDIMYQTISSSGQIGVGLERNVWQRMAKQWGVQGIVLDWRPRLEQEFSCEEVGLECHARSQTASYLVPWCCHKAFRHIFTILERLAEEEGLEYELDSGTALGAVKVGNFLPWDIDIDINFRTHQFSAYKDGGVANKALSEGEISLYRFNKDNYGDKDAGFFMMFYKGLEIEMMGDKVNMSQNWYAHHMKHIPTKIQVGRDLWVRTPANPGRYVRGRYGPGYLFHVQSWRNVPGMNRAFARYSPAAWQPCSNPGHHSCLNNYPIQGNMDLLPEVYN